MSTDQTADPPSAVPRGGGSAGKLDLREVASWDGDRLVFHSSAVDLLRREALSPSTSKAMSGCTARWAAERLLPRHPDPFSAAALGDSVHQILEDLFAMPYFRRSKDEAMRLLEVHKMRMWPGGDPITQAKRSEWHGRVHFLMNGLWAIEEPRQVKVKAVEQGFKPTTTVRGIPFVGYIDRTDFITLDDGTEAISLRDYKTGKIADRDKIKRYGDDHGDQMRLYAEAYFNETGIRPAKASLLYTQFGKKRDAALSKPYMSKTLASFERSWADLKRYEETATFPTKVGALCGWCPLVNTCPVAKEAGKVDRTDSALPEGNFHIPVMRPLRTEVFLDFDDDFGSAAQPGTAAEDAPDLVTEVAEEILAAEAGWVHEQDPSAHMNSSTNPDTEAAWAALGAPMSNPNPIFSEDKSWFPESGGLVNANSYAAMGVFGTVSLAYEELVKAEVPLSKDALDGLTQTFAQIVRGVQYELSGSTKWEDGLNTRLRGLLRTFIDTHPLPFGGDAAAWDAWVALGRKHVRTLALGAHRTYDAAPVENPWHALATTRPQAVNG